MVDTDWHAFCLATYKGIEGRDWEDFFEPNKDMSGAARVRKPNESQKARALWKMKAAKDRREDFYDPERKDNIWGRIKRDWMCEKSTSKTRLWHWTTL